MALVVQKYGGSSVETPEKIRELANRIISRYDSGDRLVIVVSAMGKTTNSLEAKAYAVSDDPTPREMDMLLSIGERESVSLMAIAINAVRPGLAVSFTGSQIGLITDTNHRNARVLEIKGDRLKDALETGKIPVIAGFQGVSTDKQITTLGRGGSDTTAVAVAAALGADSCEIYSDVVGVYSADPKLCPEAVLIREIDHDTMLTISSLGAKVLKDAAVEYAKRLGVNITTGLSWTGETGTVVSATGNLDGNKFASLIFNDRLWLTTNENLTFPAGIEHLRFYQRSDKSAVCVFSSDPGAGSVRCFSLSVVGSGIRSEPEKLNEMVRLIGLSSEVAAVSLSDIRFEVFFTSLKDSSLINSVHSVFFGAN